MVAVAEPLCSTEEWTRTRPDYRVYLPTRTDGRDGYNDHFLVSVTRAGVLVAIWTQGSREAAPDLRVVCSRSEDGGLNWSVPTVIADDEGRAGQVACFGFPVISRHGRIYCFYNRPRDGRDHYFSGVLGCAYSDDDGRTWRVSQVQIPFRRTRFDHPDPSVPCSCIVWQKSIRDAQGRWVVGFSRWSSVDVFPRPTTGHHLDTSSEVMRFENIDDILDPHDLEITWLPAGDQPLRVPCPIEPERSRGYSLCEEPSLALLPDGRLFMVLRTVTGRIWYTASNDAEGRSWRRPEPLRYRDGAEEVLHPKAPCPLFALGDGRFLLLYHNHDGFGYGARGPWDMNARRPLFLAVGEYRPAAHQPIWFSHPNQLCDTHGIGIGPESLIWLAMYSSLTEQDGRRILWYPDRKHFLLGRLLTDELLAGMEVPQA